MNIAIIGAGWFGCHLAVALLDKGHDVAVFEREADIFTGASSNNQGRLHRGYHYCRSAQTRREIKASYRRFIDRYPTLPVKDNLYAIADDSWIDFESYYAIMCSEGLTYPSVGILRYPDRYGLRHIQGDCVFVTKERVINTQSAKTYFINKLYDKIHFNYDIVDIHTSHCWDAVIDCTSGELSGQPDIFFEPACLAEYDGPANHFAVTIMDGHYPCLYPTATPGRWRVSHVLHTARGMFDRAADARKVLNELDPVGVTNAMTEAMEWFYPNFPNLFKPRYELVKAVRTKLKNNDASRAYRIVKEGNVLRVFSGKICSIFLVEDEVMDWLETL